MKRLVAAPMLYSAWAAFVVVALASTYRIEPYVFAFATLILGWMSAGFAVTGLGVIVFMRRLAATARVGIALALGRTGLAVAIALHTLAGFSWT